MKRLNDFISINDIFRLGLPSDEEYVSMPLSLFNYAFKEKTDFYIWKEQIQNFNRERIEREIPAFCQTPDITFSYLLREKENKEIYLCIDPARYFLSLYTYYNRDSGRYKPSQLEAMRKRYLRVSNSELLDMITDELKLLKSQYNCLISSGKYDGEVKNQLIDLRGEINWYIKNCDTIMNTYLQEIPSSILSSVNIDLLYLLLCMEASNNTYKIEDNNIHYNHKSISYLENYILLCDYLEKVNMTKYEESITLKSSAGKIAKVSTDTIKGLMSEYYSTYPELKTRERKYTTYQDLFINVLKDARKKIKKEDFVTKLQLKWNILPKGETSSVRDRVKNSIMNHSNNSKDAETILQEKLDYFSNLDYIGLLEGMDTFLGYEGYVLENGNVILEHFYKEIKKYKKVTLQDKKVKNIMEKVAVPVKEECIYVMSIKDLSEMSQLSKPEIIQLKQSHQNRSVRRVYHKEGWQQNLTKICQSSYYNDMDLDEIQDILEDLSKSSNKVKK